MHDKIILVGDIHGAYPKLGYDIRRKKIEDAIIIQVGDFGMGFHKPNYYKTELGKLNEILKESNSHLYAIRGNHDDPEYFKNTNNPFDLTNITLLADYSERNFLGYNILFVGGALSVDRRFRVKGKSYWTEEEFILKSKSEFPVHLNHYDVVITHTRPLCCGSFKGFDKIEYWCENDSDLKDNLINEGQNLDELYKRTKPKKWFYGHFHKSDEITFEDTTFRCLDIDEHLELL